MQPFKEGWIKIPPCYFAAVWHRTEFIFKRLNRADFFPKPLLCLTLLKATSMTEPLPSPHQRLRTCSWDAVLKQEKISAVLLQHPKSYFYAPIKQSTLLTVFWSILKYYLHFPHRWNQKQLRHPPETFHEEKNAGKLLTQIKNVNKSFQTTFIIFHF